jgi:hypothetical protein
VTSKRKGEDVEKEKLSVKLARYKKILKKKWKQFQDKMFFVTALFYAVYESTSRASMLGAGRCSECMDNAVIFGMLVAIALVVPLLLVASKRCGQRISKRWQKIKKGLAKYGTMLANTDNTAKKSTTPAGAFAGGANPTTGADGVAPGADL